MTNPVPVLSRFAKVKFTRTSYLYFQAEVQSPVMYCPRGRKPIPLVTKQLFGLGDRIARLIPWVSSLNVGEGRIAKVRLRTLGYDRLDRAVS